MKSHKNQTKCQGRRDRTQFLSLARMNDTTLRNDYHFLEDVLTKSEKGKRLIKDLGVRFGGVAKKRKLEEKRSLADDTRKNGDDALPLQPLLQLDLSEDKKGREQTFPLNDEKRELVQHPNYSAPQTNNRVRSKTPEDGDFDLNNKDDLKKIVLAFMQVTPHHLRAIIRKTFPTSSRDNIVSA